MSASVTSGSSMPIRERPTRARMSSPRSAACSPRNGPRSFPRAELVDHLPGLVLVEGGDPEDDVVEGLGEDPAEAEHDDRAELGVVEEAGDEFPAAGEHRLDQVSFEIRPRGRGDLRRRPAHLPRILQIQADEAPLRLVRQLRPETLEDDGEPDPFRGGRGLLRRRRDRLRHDRHAVLPSAPPWTPPRSGRSGLPLSPSGSTQLRSSYLPLRDQPCPGLHRHTFSPHGPRPGYRAAARRLHDLPVFLVDHPPVELVEFPQHRVLLLGAEIVQDGEEEVLVLLLDVTRIKGNELLQALRRSRGASPPPRDTGSWPRPGA